MDGSLPSFEERGAYIQSTHELADQLIELAGHLNAGTYRFLSLIAEFDRRSGWSCGATQDCAHWLNCYLPFLTMSGNQKCLADLIGKSQLRSRRASSNCPT